MRRALLAVLLLPGAVGAAGLTADAEGALYRTAASPGVQHAEGVSDLALDPGLSPVFTCGPGQLKVAERAGVRTATIELRGRCDAVAVLDWDMVVVSDIRDGTLTFVSQHGVSHIWRLPEAARSLAANGDTLYAAGASDLQAVDLRDGSVRRLTAGLDEGLGGLRSLSWAHGALLAIAAHGGILRLTPVAGRMQVERLGSVGDARRAILAVSGRLLFIQEADARGRLRLRTMPLG